MVEIGKRGNTPVLERTFISFDALECSMALFCGIKLLMLDQGVNLLGAWKIWANLALERIGLCPLWPYEWKMKEIEG